MVSWSTETTRGYVNAGLSRHEANGIGIDVTTSFLASVLSGAEVSDADAAILHEKMAEMYRSGRAPKSEEVEW